MELPGSVQPLIISVKQEFQPSVKKSRRFCGIFIMALVRFQEYRSMGILFQEKEQQSFSLI